MMIMKGVCKISFALPNKTELFKFYLNCCLEETIDTKEFFLLNNYEDLEWPIHNSGKKKVL
jgi:hypothetical protein